MFIIRISLINGLAYKTRSNKHIDKISINKKIQWRDFSTFYDLCCAGDTLVFLSLSEICSS